MVPTYRELHTVTQHTLTIAKHVHSINELTRILYSQSDGFRDLANIFWRDSERAATKEDENEQCRMAEHMENISWIYEMFAWSAESFAWDSDEHAYPFNYQMVKDCIAQKNS